ncbi:hypothetical protein ABZ652_01155 [Micromonospora chalcea]|uniref:hypothetical protein n=1 Tax=Micromonospora chalcea TaxID=1874 RepID=UPI0033FE0BCE
MSNRKKLRPTPALSLLIRANDGAQISGGCPTCNAYQTVRADAYGPNVHAVTVHHDDWCPTYRVLQGNAGARR